ETAAVLVGKQLDGEQRQPARFLEPAGLSRRDVELVEAVRDVRVVVEVADAGGASCSIRAKEPAVGGERPEQELREAPSRVEPLCAVEPPPGLGQRRERQAVPRRDRLVVPSGLRPRRADCEEPLARLRADLAADDRAPVLERLE